MMIRINRDVRTCRKVVSRGMQGFHYRRSRKSRKYVLRADLDYAWPARLAHSQQHAKSRSCVKITRP